MFVYRPLATLETTNSPLEHTYWERERERFMKDFLQTSESFNAVTFSTRLLLGVYGNKKLIYIY